MNYLQKKKLAFMSIVNRIKGFIRTVTGVLPLTLTNCVDEDCIIKFKLYGQNGGVGENDENTGKYAIPITVSGKNILNPNNFKGGSLTTYNGILCYKYLDGGSGNFTYTDDFKASTQYTFTIKIYSTDSTKNTAIKFTYTDGTSNTLVIRDNVFYTSVTMKGKTLQSIKGEWYYGVTRYIDLSVSQLEEGTIATDYEPYHEPITTNLYVDKPLYSDEFVKVLNIPTFKGTTIVSADTTIQPSNVEIEYYSNIKE